MDNSVKLLIAGMILFMAVTIVMAKIAVQKEVEPQPDATQGAPPVAPASPPSSPETVPSTLPPPPPTPSPDVQPEQPQPAPAEKTDWELPLTEQTLSDSAWEMQINDQYTVRVDLFKGGSARATGVGTPLIIDGAWYLNGSNL